MTLRLGLVFLLALVYLLLASREAVLPDLFDGGFSIVAIALPDVLGEAFPHSRPETRTALAANARVRTFLPGQTFLEQGDDSSLALVLDGHVALRRTTVEGRQLIVRIVTRGGLAAILPLAARPAVADVVALTPSPAALWRGEEARALASLDPGLAVDMLDHTLATFEEVIERLDDLIYQSALRRVAHVLDLHAGLFFSERPVLNRTHLPMMIGTSREMTGRVLRILEARHVVARVGRDRLRLLDPAGLTAAAETGTGRSARPSPTTSETASVSKFSESVSSTVL